jgi:1-acyl-sn-glycerol-3-phosphate acyltransferase
MTGLVKVESWDNPLLRTIFDLIDAIPLRRGEVDRAALKQALAALKSRYLLGIAPEGTRTHDGKLIQGHHGVAMLGLLSKAPILPAAHYGGEAVRSNLRRLRRTDIYLVVGRPFYLVAGEAKVTKEVRQQMVDEIMYQIAALLPASYRGYYSDLSAATTTYLRFLPQEGTAAGVS